MLNSPLPPPPLQRTSGTARLSTKAGAGRTRLATLFQEGAARIRLPRTHEPTLEAVLINTAGGLTGGDHMHWAVEAAHRTSLRVTAPAAERIYRSPDADVAVDIRLTVGDSARLDWLPQETILFDGARLARRIEVDLAGSATLLMVEAVLLGRQAMGETAASAKFVDDWRVRRAGRLIHAEAGRLTTDPREREALSLLAGAGAFATLLYIGADAEKRDAAIRRLPKTPRLGSSRIGEKLVVRALAPSGIALRRAIVPVIASLSENGRVPRLWEF